MALHECIKYKVAQYLSLFHGYCVYFQVINNKKQLSCSFCPFPAIKCPDITVDENVLVTGNRLQSSYGNVLQFGCRNRLLALYGPLHILLYCFGKLSLCLEQVHQCSAPSFWQFVL